MRPTTFAGESVLVTGADRGLGQALVGEALSRAQNASMPERDGLTYADGGVMPVMIDVTDRTQIQAALDILINDAGVSVPDDLNDRSAFERLSGNQAHASVLLQALRRRAIGYPQRRNRQVATPRWRASYWS